MKRHQKLAGTLALGGALALVISGCAPAGNDGGEGGSDKPAVETAFADYNPQPRENLQEGGEANFWIAEITPQMNRFSSDASADTTRIAAWYTPQVTLMDPDGTYLKNDAYLDTWEYGVEDGKTVIHFTVTDEATWNDGTPIDWTAFEATWLTNRSSDEGYSQNSTDGYKDIESVAKGETDKDVIVTFKNEYAWPQGLFSQLVHPAVNTPELFNEGFLENPRTEWGAGPYTVTDYDLNAQTVTLEPNEKWWGDKPLLDKVVFRGLDASASINAFKNGEVDFVDTTSADRLAQVADMEGVVTYRAQQTANTLIILDADKPQLSDVKVREAFFRSIDVDQQKKIAWNGLDYEEESSGSFTLYSFQPQWRNSLQEAGMKFDVEGAKKLLDEAGWEEGEDGIREKDGEKLELTYPLHSDSPTQEALAKALQQQLKATGFDLKIDVRSPQDFSTDFTTKNWDAYSLRFTSGDPLGAAGFCQIFCSDSTLNLSGTGSAEIDKKIHEELETITDPEEQTAKAMELEAEIFADTWGIFPLYNGPSIYTVKEGLANLTPEPYTGLDGFGVQPVENVGWEK